LFCFIYLIFFVFDFFLFILERNLFLLDCIVFGIDVSPLLVLSLCKTLLQTDDSTMGPALSSPKIHPGQSNRLANPEQDDNNEKWSDGPFEDLAPKFAILCRILHRIRV
jgi:hypothetical protein